MWLGARSGASTRTTRTGWSSPRKLWREILSRLEEAEGQARPAEEDRAQLEREKAELERQFVLY